MINIDHLRHKLGIPYQKQGDMKRSYKIQSQNETERNKIHRNGSKHVTHFVIITSNSRCAINRA